MWSSRAQRGILAGHELSRGPVRFPLNEAVLIGLAVVLVGEVDIVILPRWSLRSCYLSMVHIPHR